MDTNAPAPAYRLDHLSDSDLLASTRCCVGRSNQILAVLLAHLAEVEARGIHRTQACSSLYTYCIYELRMSEDAAFRRAQAAKIARRFPIVLDHVAAGELHLTGLLMLGSHLTEANHVEVLARARHRTKKEIAALIRLLDPVPDVPARVEPLGPELRPISAPTWAEFAASLCPSPIRQLEPGKRPRDWIDADGAGAGAELLQTAAAPCVEGPELVRRSPPSPTLVPQRYKVQFTATQEYVDLLEEARDLLAHALPDRALEAVHLRAMQLLVAELKRRKYAVLPSRSSDASPRRRGRWIPAEVRRAVWQRDDGRCTYVDGSGRRCRETSYLELHHEHAFARGGPATKENITLRCRAHNALAAEEDFGPELMARKTGARPALAREVDARPWLTSAGRAAHSGRSP